MLEERVTAVECNTSPATIQRHRRKSHSPEPAYDVSSLPDIDPRLSDGSHIGSHSMSGPSATGHYSVASQSPAGESSRGAASKMFIENLLQLPEIAQSCRVWFEKYHPWFPLLHQQTLLQCLDDSADIASTGRPLVLQAIVVATLESMESVNATPKSPHDQGTELKNVTVLAALNAPCLDSIQAFLVLSMVQYGNGCITEAGNLLAMCRK
jgi:hypothetical protein